MLRSAVLHVDDPVLYLLPVADVEVVQEFAVARALRAGHPHADRMRRHDAAVILEIGELGAPQRIGEPYAVMQSGVHVAIRGMESTDPHGRLVAELIADLKALEIGADMTVGAYFEDEFR